jgi:hypothetical protein
LLEVADGFEAPWIGEPSSEGGSPSIFLRAGSPSYSFPRMPIAFSCLSCLRPRDSTSSQSGMIYGIFVIHSRRVKKLIRPHFPGKLAHSPYPLPTLIRTKREKRMPWKKMLACVTGGEVNESLLAGLLLFARARGMNRPKC